MTAQAQPGCTPPTRPPSTCSSADALALPLARQNGGWVATTCVPAGTYTPVRRAQRAAYTASRAAAKRAKRRTRR